MGEMLFTGQPNEQVCSVHMLGLMDYEAAWKMQDEIGQAVGEGRHAPELLLLEHPHTYTMGRKGEATSLLWDERVRAENGVNLYYVDRGGDVTYHGPGQLVGYPILPLATPGWQGERLPQADYVGYVRKLEKALILTLLSFGLAGGQISGKTGVWVQPDLLSRCPRCLPENRQQPAKIASIGVKVDRNGVTRHGFALNVAPDMRYWDGIVPCGLNGVHMTSLAELLEDPPGVETVAEQVIVRFGEVFGYKMVKEHP